MNAKPLASAHEHGTHLNRIRQFIGRLQHLGSERGLHFVDSPSEALVELHQCSLELLSVLSSHTLQRGDGISCRRGVAVTAEITAECESEL